jgi:hypothetical protein
MNHLHLVWHRPGVDELTYSYVSKGFIAFDTILQVMTGSWILFTYVQYVLYPHRCGVFAEKVETICQGALVIQCFFCGPPLWSGVHVIAPL